jgi:hypothetical protein
METNQVPVPGQCHSLEGIAGLLDSLPDVDKDRLIDMLEDRKSVFLRMADTRWSKLDERINELCSIVKLFVQAREVGQAQAQLIVEKLVSKIRGMKRKPTKVMRNPLVQEELAKGMSLEQVFGFLKEHHPKLVMKGKGKNTQLITFISFKKEFQKWQKAKAT